MSIFLPPFYIIKKFKLSTYICTIYYMCVYIYYTHVYISIDVELSIKHKKAVVQELHTARFHGDRSSCARDHSGPQLMYLFIWLFICIIYNILYNKLVNNPGRAQEFEIADITNGRVWMLLKNRRIGWKPDWEALTMLTEVHCEEADPQKLWILKDQSELRVKTLKEEEIKGKKASWAERPTMAINGQLSNTIYMRNNSYRKESVKKKNTWKRKRKKQRKYRKQYKIIKQKQN